MILLKIQFKRNICDDANAKGVNDAEGKAPNNCCSARPPVCLLYTSDAADE